jgi:hypothetical protein
MKDGSDAIADWPILNALLNAANGASWVSFHHGGGVGIGWSLHAGMVVVADGTDGAERRLARVLRGDPALGVLRHADAGYEEAERVAREHQSLIILSEEPHPCRTQSPATQLWSSGRGGASCDRGPSDAAVTEAGAVAIETTHRGQPDGDLGGGGHGRRA